MFVTTNPVGANADNVNATTDCTASDTINALTIRHATVSNETYVIANPNNSDSDTINAIAIWNATVSDTISAYAIRNATNSNAVSAHAFRNHTTSNTKIVNANRDNMKISRNCKKSQTNLTSGEQNHINYPPIHTVDIT